MVADTGIPAGYKQTEVGVIPEDWDVQNFGQLVYYTKGFAFKSKDYCSNGVRIIRISDTTYDSIKETNAIYISEDETHKYKKWRLTEDDLIFSTVGSKPPMYDSLVGKAIIINKKYDGCLLNQNAVLIRAKQKTKYKQQILLNHFKTKRYVQYIESIYRGNANQASITLEDLFKYPIPLPKLNSELFAIATILSDTDALINHLENLIAKKKNIKQGVMQQLLTGKKRLPGFSGEWEVKKLGDIFSLTATYSKSKFIDDGGNYLIMDMGSVSSVGQMIASKKTFLSVDSLKIGDLVMPKDDIGGGNIIGKVAYIDQNNKYVLSDHVYKLTAINSDANPLFFSYLINSNVINSELKKKVSGSAQLGLGRKSVEEQDAKIPKDKSEQSAIATILSDMDAEIESLEQKRDKYTMIKQGMMQELLTGKTRLV